MDVVTIEVASGKHTETFQLLREAATANRVADLIREAFVLPEGADVPAVTYEDDEGDTISLNLGVAVEFGEALRVMELGESPLRFKLVQTLAPREKLETPEPAPVPAAPTVDPEKEALRAKAAENAKRYAAELEKHALLRAQYQKDRAAYEKELAAHAQAREQCAKDDAKATAAASVQTSAVASFDAMATDMVTGTAGVVNQISVLLQNHTAGMAQRVDALEGKVAAESRRADNLANSHAQVEQALRAERAAAAELRQQLEQMRAENQALAQAQVAAQAKHSREQEALVAQHSIEKKGLVDTIAEQSEQLSTQRLKLQDMQKEGAQLRKQLDSVYGKIAGLLPDSSPAPSPFVKAVEKAVKGFEDFTGAVEAVAVATGKEVTEAVRSTHNYAAQPAADAASAAKQGGGAAAAAAAAAQAPSDFVQMMDSQMDRAISELEVELAADDAAAAASAAAAAAAPAASEAEKAFRRIRDMGFDVTQERVSELMAKHNGQLDAAISELF